MTEKKRTIIGSTSSLGFSLSPSLHTRIPFPCSWAYARELKGGEFTFPQINLNYQGKLHTISPKYPLYKTGPNICTHTNTHYTTITINPIHTKIYIHQRSLIRIGYDVSTMESVGILLYPTQLLYFLWFYNTNAYLLGGKKEEKITHTKSETLALII